MSLTPGTEGYEKFIPRFIEGSQALDFHLVCKDFVDFLPQEKGKVLDAGAGAGQNAAALAERGYIVTAVEPMTEFLTAAQSTYKESSIEWIQGSLPLLECLGSASERFDFILIDGVWHHLSDAEQVQALKRISALLNSGGKCAISLRNGPPGMGICVYPTDVNWVIKQAKEVGLESIFLVENQPSIFSYKKGVTWARVVFEKIK